jgi:hypothetical protein
MYTIDKIFENVYKIKINIVLSFLVNVNTFFILTPG